ncbi:hypothetical protein [Nocardioides sp. InS609-2]|uniref:hypothetical protein n=1 Tax=Nocardioides sp. InS609-2 TaxID=2760705 RepID=UPI0020BDEC08|nr:hypothetical protein [Nocardioides sp. InS609-2]
MTRTGHPLLALRPWRRHSLVLAVAGLVYILIGLVYILVPLTVDRSVALELALRVAPPQVWGGVWVIVGLLSLASTRWPPTSETWGYTSMSSLAALWAAIYALSMLFFGAPRTGVTAVAVWSLLAFMWWSISGLRNPDDIPRAR